MHRHCWLIICFLALQTILCSQPARAACDPSSPVAWVLTSRTHSGCDTDQTRERIWKFDSVDKILPICADNYLQCETVNGATKIVTLYGYSLASGTYWDIRHEHTDAPGAKAPVCPCPDGSIPPGRRDGLELTAFENSTYTTTCAPSGNTPQP